MNNLLVESSNFMVTCRIVTSTQRSHTFELVLGSRIIDQYEAIKISNCSDSNTTEYRDLDVKLIEFSTELDCGSKITAPNSLKTTKIRISSPTKIDELPLQRKPLSILYRSTHTIVINKPSGLCTEDLIQQISEDATFNFKFNSNVYNIASVSRLDFQTSGALVVPLTQHAEEYLTQLFKNRSVKKTYLCLVNGPISVGTTGQVRSVMASSILRP